MISADQLRQFIDYNPATGHLTWKVGRRGGARPGQRAGNIGSQGYRIVSILGREYKEHRIVWLHVHGRWPEHEIDHINCVKDDNRLDNLRDVQRRMNAENVIKPRSHSASGFLGVRAHRGRWLAEIRIDGEQRELGHFDTPAEAHSAYVAAKRKHHEGCTI